jgi:hypothetical protein
MLIAVGLVKKVKLRLLLYALTIELTFQSDPVNCQTTVIGVCVCVCVYMFVCECFRVLPQK